MTSLRKLLKQHGVEKFVELYPKEIEQFWEMLGQVPMCCYKMDKKGNMKCDMLRKYLSKKEFKEYCLICQARIAQKLCMKWMHKKPIMDYTKDDIKKITLCANLMMKVKREYA